MDNSIMYDVSYGLYVVGAYGDNVLAGCIVNSVFQISAEPVKIAVSLHYDNYTAACIQNSREFSISVLTQSAPMELISTFGFYSSREKSKFGKYSYRTIVNNIPVLTEHTSVWLHCKVENIVDVGTHALFIAEVVDGERICDDVPMTYSYYRNNIKGTAPKKAPSYQPPKTEGKYVCTVCNYVYTGDDFESLPDDWVCPICGVGKDKFVLKQM